MLPTHRPLSHPTPVVTLTFSSSVKFEIWILIRKSDVATRRREVEGILLGEEYQAT
jgi:hypothetical protein